MALTEESRHRLFRRLEELLGLEEASTLMELLPPVGWADVATKRDLDHLEEHLGARIDRVEVRLDARIDAVESGLGARIDAVESRLGARTSQLELGLGAAIAQVELKVEGLRSEMYRQQRNQTIAIIGAKTTIVALLLTAFQML